MKNRVVNKHGFTLVELIVVIAIMGVILILALPQVSRIQSANKNKKYETYKESLESAAKIYIDNHSEDLFGNNPTGCVTIKYSQLKTDNLIKDFAEEGVVCSNDDETFVDVTKLNDEYKYSTDLVCYKGSEKIEYKDSDDADASVCENHGGGSGDCEGEECDPNDPSRPPDSDPPIIDIDPDNSGNKWYNAERINSVLKLKIIVSDQNGLNKNIGVTLDWKQLDGSNVENYKFNFNNDKLTNKNSKVSSLIPVDKIPHTPKSTGKYQLTVSPDNSSGWGVQDALGNESIGKEVAKEYWIDNTPPTMDPKIKSTSDDYNALTTKITMNGKDNIGLDKVYISNTGYEEEGKWQDYKNSISWNVGGELDGEKRKIYITLMDVAGNKVNKTLEYTVYKVCDELDEGKWVDTTECTAKCNGGKKNQKKTYTDAILGTVCKTETRTVDCNTQSCVSAKVLNKSAYICPEDQNKPSRTECVNTGVYGKWNALSITSVSVSGTEVTIKGHLVNNGYYVSWQADDPNRTVCIATSSNVCKQNLCKFSIATQGYAGAGSSFCHFNTTIDVSENKWTAGNYRVIVNSGGGSPRWRIKTTSYMVNLFKVTK